MLETFLQIADGAWRPSILRWLGQCGSPSMPPSGVKPRP
jgi:hypothetical protein